MVRSVFFIPLGIAGGCRIGSMQHTIRHSSGGWELGGWVIATAAMLSSVLLVASFSCSPPVLSL